MGDYSTPIAVDLGVMGGQIYIAYEEIHGSGVVSIRWFQDGGEDGLPQAVAFPHYDEVLRLIEVLLWGVMAARKVEQTERGF